MRLFRVVLALGTVAVTASAQDTVRVRTGAPRWGPSVGLTTLHTIGGPPDYELGFVWSVAVDAARRLYTFEYKTKQLNVHDADGTFIRKIGRRGSGPGEYGDILGLTVIRDSLVTIYDLGQARITRFRPDGTLDGTIQLNRPLTGTSSLLPSDNEGHVYLKSHYYMGSDGKAVSLPQSKLLWHRIRADGTIADSIPEPRLTDPTDPAPSAVESGMLMRNFVPETSVRPAATGGLVFGNGETYRFWIRPMRGPVRAVEREWAPVALTSDERAEWIEMSSARSRRDPKHPEYKIPTTKPAYRGFYVDADGRIWIALYAKAQKRELPPPKPNALPEVSWFQDPVFDVFDPMGAYLGNVTLPYGSRWMAARGDRVYALSSGPDGEHLLTTYRLTGIKK
jgi:hypothetical protein